jgi:mRNA interferase YafQ
MRTISYTSQFKKDYRRTKAGQLGGILETLLQAVVDQLAADVVLSPRHRDHALAGQWTDFRDCHLRPDLVLIYRKPDSDTLELVRLGSHSQLGL